MIIRSVCCLVPSLQPVSSNITVKRIVDRFLEHTRIFIFGDGEDKVVAMGSSDLMIRNLRHRIEVVVPLHEERCKNELVDYFEIQWQDNTQAVFLNNKMEMEKAVAIGPERNAQQEIYSFLKNKL
jgi:polyphosphate kinase